MASKSHTIHLHILSKGECPAPGGQCETLFWGGPSQVSQVLHLCRDAHNS